MRLSWKDRKRGGHLGFKDEQINDEHFSLEHILPEVIDEVKDIETHYGEEYSGNRGWWNLHW